MTCTGGACTRVDDVSVSRHDCGEMGRVVGGGMSEIGLGKKRVIDSRDNITRAHVVYRGIISCTRGTYDVPYKRCVVREVHSEPIYV